MQLTQRVVNLEPSATLAVSARAKQLKAEGVDVVSFGAGEPDFDTPSHIKDAAKDALDAGDTKYPSPAAGIKPLKEAICEKFDRDNQLQYTPDQVVVGCGGKDVLYLAFQALIDSGDEVLLPTPCWVSYAPQTRLAGGNPVFLPTTVEDGFKLRPETLRDSLSKRAKVLVINSPCNPTGMAYSPDDLRALADVVAETDLLVFSDEIYDHLMYTDFPFLSFAATRPDMMDRTVTFNGLSKTYAMTGWRIGYAGGPKPLISAMARLISQSTSGVASFCQTAAVTALRGDQGAVEQMRKEFVRRGEHMAGRLNAINGVTCLKPQGAFYCFPDVSAHYGKPLAGKECTNSLEFARIVLEEANVALVPGGPFGADSNVRLSFATSMAQIDKGLDRLQNILTAK